MQTTLGTVLGSHTHCVNRSRVFFLLPTATLLIFLNYRMFILDLMKFTNMRRYLDGPIWTLFGV